ncbi:MAG: TIGR01777 family protein [Phycisphaerales bacterium]|nr:TIGR01777 family protein [Phycisphaerales bacterium]
MNVAVTGSSGLVGTKLVAALRGAGDAVRRLVRGDARNEDSFAWDPAGGSVDPAALAGVDAVVHLAGEGIANKRWSEAQMARIRDSRLQGTRTLVRAIVAADPRPRVLVSASAIGYYGDRGDAVLDESAGGGSGFLPDVCRAWEAETKAAADAGVRVVRVRIGVVLSPEGGALAKMLTPFKLGAGGVLGSGKQYMSWIDLDDLVRIIQFAITTDSLSGAVNGVAPTPVTNREFTKTLGGVLKRPTIFPMPAFAARAAFGKMAEDLLLASTRVVPKRLADAGFSFAYPSLEGCLRHQLGR